MNTVKKALVPAVLVVVVIALAAPWVSAAVSVDGSLILTSASVPPNLQYMLSLQGLPNQAKGVLLPMPNSLLSNVTIIMGQLIGLFSANYNYITPSYTVPSGASASYVTSNATVVYSGGAGTVSVVVNYTIPWNYVWNTTDAVYGYEYNYGSFPFVWVPITVFDYNGGFSATVTAYLVFPNGTTKQVPFATYDQGYNGAFTDPISIFLDPYDAGAWGGYYSITISSTRAGSSTGGIGVPIGALLYYANIHGVKVVVSIRVSFAAGLGRYGVGLSGGGHPDYSWSTSVFAGDSVLGWYSITSPLFVQNITCFFNIVSQVFGCVEGPHYVYTDVKGPFIVDTSWGVSLFWEYPTYFTGSGGYMYFWVNGMWLNSTSFFYNTYPSYYSGRLAEAYYTISAPYWSTNPIYTRYDLAAPYNGPVLSLFLRNYTQSDFANRLYFSAGGGTVVGNPANSLLRQVTVGDYSLWAYVVDLAGERIAFGNTLSSGFSLVYVLDASDLSVLSVYNVSAGSNVSLFLQPGKYLIINMIPPQYNATYAPSLSPDQYVYAYSFDPAAQVIYATVFKSVVTLSIAGNVYPFVLNFTAVFPNGTTTSTVLNITQPVSLILPSRSKVTLTILKAPPNYVPINSTSMSLFITDDTTLTYVFCSSVYVTVVGNVYPFYVDVVWEFVNGTTVDVVYAITGPTVIPVLNGSVATVTVLGGPLGYTPLNSTASYVITGNTKWVFVFVKSVSPFSVGSLASPESLWWLLPTASVAAVAVFLVVRRRRRKRVVRTFTPEWV